MLCLSMFTLARANGWTRAQSALASFGIVFGSVTVLAFLLTRPILSPFAQELIGGLVLVIVSVVLFARSKSVSHKLSNDNAPR